MDGGPSNARPFTLKRQNNRSVSRRRGRPVLPGGGSSVRSWHEGLSPRIIAHSPSDFHFEQPQPTHWHISQKSVLTPDDHMSLTVSWQPIVCRINRDLSMKVLLIRKILSICIFSDSSPDSQYGESIASYSPEVDPRRHDSTARIPTSPDSAKKRPLRANTRRCRF